MKKTNELAESVKKAMKEKASDSMKMSEKEQADVKEAFAMAQQPIEFTDADMKLGVQEIDIRKLSKENMAQMLFRLQCQQLTMSRQLAQILIDLERIVILLLTKTTDVKSEELSHELTDLVGKLERVANQQMKSETKVVGDKKQEA